MIELIALRELSSLLKIDRHTILTMYKSGQFPAPLIISKRKFRWVIADIEKWIHNLKENV